MIVYIWSERRFCSTVGLSFKIYNILISWIFLSFEIVVFKVSVYVILFTKMNPITDIFQVICLHLTTLCFKVDFYRKRYNFEIEWRLCYSKYLVLYFQLLLFVRLSDGWSIFYETKKTRLINTVCFRVQIIKEYMKITGWKHTVKSAVHGTFK